MRKHLLLAFLVGAVCLLSAGALAGLKAWKHPAYAEVVSVEPVRESRSRPDKACHEAQLKRRKALEREARAPGLVIGGMAGGTVPHLEAPADNFQAGPDGRCEAANRVYEKIIAYDVRYRLHGKTTKVRMDHDPGTTLPVKDGKVVLTREREIAKRAVPKA